MSTFTSNYTSHKVRQETIVRSTLTSEVVARFSDTEAGDAAYITFCTGAIKLGQAIHNENRGKLEGQ